MKIYKTIKTVIEKKILSTVSCDVCGAEYDCQNTGSQEDIFEIQEFTHIRFTGGYGSIFGDDDDFELDICQHCLKEKLGEYIRPVDVDY